MQLWQIDIVGGVMLVDTATGVLREAKVVTGVDDHSRFCVIAAVVERATGRAVCLAFAAALARFGVPEEILTDNGKQFTDRFGKGGEVLFDKICRNNGITHRLTAPASPTRPGRWSGSTARCGRELLDDAEPFESLEAAQAGGRRLGRASTTPTGPTRPWTGRCRSARRTGSPRSGQAERDLLPLWLPPTLAPTWPASGCRTDRGELDALLPVARPASLDAGTDGRCRVESAVEFDRVVPPSGNMVLAKRQFWLGPARAGQVVRFWADCDLIHLFDRRRPGQDPALSPVGQRPGPARRRGRGPRGPVPAARPESGATARSRAVEVERCIARNGTGLPRPASRCWPRRSSAGRRVGIRIEPTTLMFFDPDTRELLRSRPNPLTPDQSARLRGSRPAGPPPRPSTEPVRVQRRASNTGVVMVVGQKVALGRVHAYRTVTIARVRDHPRDRARRRRNPRRAPHHHPGRP